MPLKPLSYREIKRKLEAAGFEVVSQKGSHVELAKDTPEGKKTTIVPCYKATVYTQVECKLEKGKNH